jgi:hypothetical protein
MAELQKPEQFLRGQSLARDRGTTAKEVTFQIEDWKFRTNVLDYRGYDVKQHDDPEFVDSWEELLREVDGLKRLANHTIDDSQTKITDFQTFKRAFEEAWDISPKDPKRARNLFGKLRDQDGYLMQIFSRPEVQAEITKNGERQGAKDLQKQFAHIRKLSYNEARNLWRQKRRHEVQLVAEGYLPIKEYRKTGALPRLDASKSYKARRGYLIAQQTKKGGTLYKRTKPRRFDKAEVRFLKNNPHVPASKLTSQFNLVFGTNRTQQSLYFKRYRLLKE